MSQFIQFEIKPNQMYLPARNIKEKASEKQEVHQMISTLYKQRAVARTQMQRGCCNMRPYNVRLYYYSYRFIEQGLTSHQTHWFIGHIGDEFGQMTQPTVSQH